MNLADPASRTETSAPAATLEQLRDVVRQLHQTAETERIALHRALHDRLGGLMVSAGMDLAGSTLPPSEPPDPRHARVRASLMQAVELNRRLTEDLRPSLLDNLGLFAALRWHIKNRCPPAPTVCHESYPADELPLTPAATTGLYRIVRESLFLVLEEEHLRCVDLRIHLEGGDLRIDLTHEHDAVERFELFRDRPEVMFGFVVRAQALKGAMSVARAGAATSLLYRFALSEIT